MAIVKLTKYWKCIADSLTWNEACEAFRTKEYCGQKYREVKIAFNHHTIDTELTQSLAEQSFPYGEIICNNWRLFVPDDEKERRVEEIRTLVNDSNVNGMINQSRDKICRMSIKEIWTEIYNRYDDEETCARFIEFFINNKLYKKS